jgi:dolichol-phosphate mannosyltransferase
MPRLLREIGAALRGQDWEVLVIDDNSPDGTALKAETSGVTNVRAFRMPRRTGYFYAVQFGIAKSRGDFIVVMDADLSHPPELLTGMLRKMEGNNVVVASRYVRGAVISEWPVLRRLISIAACLIARPLVAVNDSMSGYFMMRKAAIPCIKGGSGFKVLFEFLASARLRAVEVPYGFRGRSSGKSKMGFGIFLSFIKQALRLYLRRL